MKKSSLQEFIYHYRANTDNIVKQLVIVDFDVEYSIDRDYFNAIDKNNDLIISVQREKFFNKSLAINIGVFFTSLENVIICDADVLIDKNTLQNWKNMMDFSNIVISPEYLLETQISKIRSAPGICCLKKSLFLEVEGYSSDYIGWGFEDHDFLFRLKRQGCQVCLNGWGYHITHNNLERTRNYYSQNKAEMRSKNLALFEKRCESSDSCGTYQLDICNFNTNQTYYQFLEISRYIIK